MGSKCAKPYVGGMAKKEEIIAYEGHMVTRAKAEEKRRTAGKEKTELQVMLLTVRSQRMMMSKN